MEVHHKPKPVHSWREFLVELGTITLGVLIALGAEQTVEFIHWRSEVSIARKTLQEEITTVDRIYVNRIAIASCFAKQEQEARTLLDGLEGNGNAVPLTTFHHPPGGQLVDAEWQSERSAQVLTHFPRAELALMNRYYTAVPSMAGWFDAESAAWSELSALQNPPARLTPSDIARLRGELDRAHRLEYVTIINAYRSLKLSDQLGIVRPQLEPNYVDNICKTSENKIEARYLKAEMQP